MHIYFEQLPHTADIKLRVYGKNKQELFAHAVIGMFQILKPHPAMAQGYGGQGAQDCEIKNDILICKQLPYRHEVTIDSIDVESLLVDFLSEVLYLSDVHNEAYLKADILGLTDTHIHAKVYGVKITGFDVVEIKAVTYNELKIVKLADGWQADIVFDI